MMGTCSAKGEDQPRLRTAQPKSVDPDYQRMQHQCAKMFDEIERLKQSIHEWQRYVGNLNHQHKVELDAQHSHFEEERRGLDENNRQLRSELLRTSRNRTDASIGNRFQTDAELVRVYQALTQNTLINIVDELLDANAEDGETASELVIQLLRSAESQTVNFLSKRTQAVANALELEENDLATAHDIVCAHFKAKVCQTQLQWQQSTMFNDHVKAICSQLVLPQQGIDAELEVELTKAFTTTIDWVFKIGLSGHFVLDWDQTTCQQVRSLGRCNCKDDSTFKSVLFPCLRLASDKTDMQVPGGEVCVLCLGQS